MIVGHALFVGQFLNLTISFSLTLSSFFFLFFLSVLIFDIPMYSPLLLLDG